MVKPSNLAMAAIVVGLALAALGGVIFVTGDEATERLGMFFAFLGVLTTTVVALLRADGNHQQLNGSFDDRVKNIVLDANAARRSSDR